jgi:hypothetical protein
MSAKGDRVAALVNEVKDLHLTPAGLSFLLGYLAEHDPDAFRAALDMVIKVDSDHGHPGLLTEPHN